MKTYYLRYFILLTVSMLIAWTISCSGKAGSKTGTKSVSLSESGAEAVPEADAKLITVVAPAENSGFKLKDEIEVVISEERSLDSIRIWFDGQMVSVLTKAPWQYKISSDLSGMTGRKALKVVAYRNKTKPQTITRFVIVYSDIVPKRNGYKVIKAYPHDVGAFTQGLVYDQGVLYEGTGQEARSSLRKTKLESGEVINQLNLESELFGEGIAIMGDRIFQLTWQSKVGFVYEKASFRLISRVYYQTEGWGLTAMGNRLVMSDGTNILYIIEPETFRIISRIEVYDNKVKVDSLNELEYINGEIWANVWQKDIIARIDPETGKVLAYIDLKGICNETDTSVNVLNGIAYDSAGKRIFVTGKNWPKLYEISITE